MLKIIKSLLTNFNSIYAATVVKSEQTNLLGQLLKPDNKSKISIYFNFCHKLNTFLQTISVINCPQSYANQKNLQLSIEMDNFLSVKRESIRLMTSFINVPDVTKNKINQIDIHIDIDIDKMRAQWNFQRYYQPSNGVCPVTHFVLILDEVSNFELFSDLKELCYNYLPCMLYWEPDLLRKYLNCKNNIQRILSKWKKISKEERIQLVKNDELFDTKEMIEYLDKSKTLAIDLKNLFNELPLIELGRKFYELYEHIDFFERYFYLVSYFVGLNNTNYLFIDDYSLKKQVDDSLYNLGFDSAEIQTILPFFKSFVEMFNYGIKGSSKVFYNYLLNLNECIRYFNPEIFKHNGILNKANCIFEECIAEIDEHIELFKNFDTNEKVDKGKNSNKHEERIKT